MADTPAAARTVPLSPPRPVAAASDRALLPLTFTALGVVYGDIGTSPLYALRECFFGSHSVPPTPENVLGVLSLIIYSLLLVISVKYVAIVMRADNEGEGGILALTALLPVQSGANGRTAGLVLLGIFGTALLYGDGMITPAITVLGAVEGLHVATPVLQSYVVPIAVAILVVVFAIQRHGTHAVGRLFAPMMLAWFVTIGLLGAMWIVRAPAVLEAVNPAHAVTFFGTHRLHGVAVLGAVFLVVTGGEALYADMGHFGKAPIRLAWFIVVLPALLLNYFGQGALLLTTELSAPQPFFLLAPSWALLPLVGIATCAAVIASQALISGAFSLTRQAVQLGYWPRLDIEHTSSREMGQVYVPQVNWFLMISTLAIVIGFESSGALAAAYGIAVALTMVITAILLYVVMTSRWKWPLPVAIAITALFVTIDGAFLGANALKIGQGGWLPLVVGGALFTLMTTWKSGRRVLAARLLARGVPFEEFLELIDQHPPIRVPGTAVFLTAHPSGTPPALLHNLRHNHVMHQQVVVLRVATAHVPHVAPEDQVQVEPQPAGVFRVGVTYGFMDDPDIPAALRLARDHGLDIDTEGLSYFLGRETIVVTRAPGMMLWRERLFALMARNAVRATTFFHIPPDRVVELGAQVEI